MSSDERADYIRIAKGELGPNASQAEINALMGAIHNRQNHRDIPHDLKDSSQYHTLKHPHHNYNLTPQQEQRFNQGYEQRTNPNNNFTAWDTSNSSIQSNRYYEWTPVSKIGSHHFYTCNPRK